MMGRATSLAYAAAVLGVALVLVAIAAHWLGPAEFALPAVLLGVACLLGSAILDPHATVLIARSRRTRIAGRGLAFTVACLALLVVINVLASHGTQALDLSRAQVNTLAPQSIKAVKELSGQLQVTGFYSAQSQSSQQSEAQLLALYQAQSPKVSVRFLDPSKNGALVQQLGVHEDGSLVLQYRGRDRILLPGSEAEQDVTGAIVGLEAKVTPTVCWAGGDGERDLANQDQYLGYSSAAQELPKNNLRVEDLLLPEAASIPRSCSAVAIVGPAKPLTSLSIHALQAYVRAGGRVLVALDPWQSQAVVTSVNNLLQPFQLGFGGGLVVDPQSLQGDPSTPAVLNYGASPIATGLDREVSFFPQATAVKVQSQGNGLPITVAASSTGSYEVLHSRSNWATRQPQDLRGPFPLMASVEIDSGSHDARLVAVGSGSFADNQMLALQAVNVQLFTGSLQWLTSQQNLIALPPRPSATVSVALTAAQAQVNLFITLLLLPGLVALGGVAVWWRRRVAFA